MLQRRPAPDSLGRPDVRVVVGPVLGAVTPERAVVLLEVSRGGPVTCFASVVDDAYPTGRVVAGARPYRRSRGGMGAGCARGRARAHAAASLDMLALRPRAFVLTGLVPGARHVISFSGVNRADAQCRLAHVLVPLTARALEDNGGGTGIAGAPLCESVHDLI